MSVDGGGREVAYRLFAAEFDDATVSHTESDEERAPNYVITPTGARVNRLFVVGTLTEVTQVNEEMVRARIVDPTGAFVVYAGQYQPDQLAYLERAEPPCFVAVTGKARTFEPDDGDRVYTSVRPESIATVDADTRDRWVVDAAERTITRIGTYAAAANREERGEDLTAALGEVGVETGLARGIPLAMDHYDTTPGYLAALRELAVEAARVVAGELEEVSRFELRPDEPVADAPGFPSLASRTSEQTATADEPATGASGSPEPQEEPIPAESREEPAPAGRESGSEAASTGSEPEIEVGDEPEPEDEGVSESEPEDEVGDESEVGDEPDLGDGLEAEDEPDLGDGLEAEDEMDLGDEPATEGELGEFDSGGIYEMDEDERAEIEAEFGAEFTTGTEVEEPGEADIEVPDPEDLEPVEDEPAVDSEMPPDDGADEVSPDEEATPDDGAVSDEGEPPEEADEDLDLLEYVVETMGELDEGDGAPRDRLTERVVDELDVEEGAVADAIQDALMGGRCYEPDDGLLKPI